MDEQFGFIFSGQVPIVPLVYEAALKRVGSLVASSQVQTLWK